jgi:hypothetical protein
MTEKPATPVGAHPAAPGGDNPRVSFRTTIRQSGKTATGIEVPPELVARLGTSKRPPVRVTINGHTYRSTIAVMGGAFMVGVSADNRAQAGAARTRRPRPGDPPTRRLASRRSAVGSPRIPSMIR